MHFQITGKPVSLQQFKLFTCILACFPIPPIHSIIIFRCFRPLPAGSPLSVLLLVTVQPLHLKCLGFYPNSIFFISITILLLTPLTNPSAVILPLTLFHPLLSLTTQIHLVGFDNHFQSSAKFLMKNVLSSPHSNIDKKSLMVPLQKPPRNLDLKINLPN